jgi:hypothetical protein
MPNSKKKGNRGENQLVHILEEAFGEGQFKRTPSSGAYTGGKNREGAENLPWEAKITLVSDIITPSDFNFVIEHKFYAEANFWDLFSDKSKWNEWIEQVEEDAKFVKKEPLLVVKYNRHKRIALISSPYLIIELVKFDLDIRPFTVWTPTDSKTGYAIVMLDDLLELPIDFWFKQEK